MKERRTGTDEVQLRRSSRKRKVSQRLPTEEEEEVESKRKQRR